MPRGFRRPQVPRTVHSKQIIIYKAVNRIIHNLLSWGALGITVSAAATPTEPITIPDSGWHHVEWLGSIYSQNPFLWETKLGWVSYQVLADGMIIFDPEMGPLWTRQDIFPHLFSYTDGHWYWLDPSSYDLQRTFIELPVVADPDPTPDPDPEPEPDPEPTYTIPQGLTPLIGEFFDIRKYGANGADDLDDTVAIRQAIEAASLANGTVFIPKGFYKVAPQTMLETEIFTITRGNFAILGEGRDETIISCYVYGLNDPETTWIEKTKAGATRLGTDMTGGSNWPFGHRFHGIVFKKRNGVIENVTLKNFRLTGNARPNGSKAWWTDYHKIHYWDITNKGISLGWGHEIIRNVTLEGLEVDNFRGEIIYSGGDGVESSTIRGCKIHGCPGSAISGPAGLIEDCEIYDVFGNGIETYLLNRSSQKFTQHLIIRNNLIEMLRTPEIVGSWPERSGYGIVVMNDPNSELNHIGQEYYNLTYRDEASTFLIEGNTLRNMGTGLYTCSFSNVIAQNNTFELIKDVHFALYSAPTPGLKLIRHMTNVVLRNNLHRCASGSNAVPYLIANGDPLEVTIEGNVVEGKPSYFLNLVGKGKPTDYVMLRNNTADVVQTPVGDTWADAGDKIRLPFEENNNFTWGRDLQTPITAAKPIVGNLTWHVVQIHTTDENVVYDAMFNNGSYFNAIPDGYEITFTTFNNWWSTLKPITFPKASWNDFTQDYIISPGHALKVVKRDGKFRLISYQ